MRGLEAREEMALGNAIATFDEELASYHYLDAGHLAECQGRSDCIHRRRMPIMFRGERYLTASWEHGYAFQQESDEMAECPHCQDDTGNPCPTHG